jgi:hypothetical protein
MPTGYFSRQAVTRAFKTSGSKYLDTQSIEGLRPKHLQCLTSDPGDGMAFASENPRELHSVSAARYSIR